MWIVADPAPSGPCGALKFNRNGVPVPFPVGTPFTSTKIFRSGAGLPPDAQHASCCCGADRLSRHSYVSNLVGKWIPALAGVSFAILDAASGDLASDYGEVEYEGGEPPTKDLLKYLVVWKKVNGEWKVLHDTYNGQSVLVRDPDGQLLMLSATDWRSALPSLPE